MCLAGAEGVNGVPYSFPKPLPRLCLRTAAGDAGVKSLLLLLGTKYLRRGRNRSNPPHPPQPKETKLFQG
jgi:hypothetical protein